ncbi:SnoaL-like domain-containing protein [Dyella jiangningensis]|uniref:nuclear transport factor 2 family protein n=1 Tax=Dyella sp. AtDHG13 TaxID=1938897 RepID=UPI00088C569B|nr:nuclear transport factor 2 family protein [Dyella sp. AtDHG13]PXV58972.1 SnoaL-like protein [Dyella sp. AtDHG13]SDL31359.1 SnoaL-like domain-containing protein [Dyella jiangningensis]
MPERHVVDTFVSLVENGRFIEALQRYYHPAAVVWENRQTSRNGLDVLIENEQRVLNAFTAVDGRALQVMVDGDRVAIQWRFEFSNDAAHVSLDEMAVQQWNDGKILHERFYYDPAQLQPQGVAPAAADTSTEASTP